MIAKMPASPPATRRSRPTDQSRASRQRPSNKAKASCGPNLRTQAHQGIGTGTPLSVSLVGPLTPSGLVVIPVKEEARTAPGSTGVPSVGTGCDGDGIGSSAMKHHQFLTSVRTVPRSRPCETSSSHSCTRCAVEGILYGGCCEPEVVL